MSEFKKLFQVKRILAIALAVAMTVTSAPVTAWAAPENPEQTEADVENDSTEASVENDSTEVNVENDSTEENVENDSTEENVEDESTEESKEESVEEAAAGTAVAVTGENNAETDSDQTPAETQEDADAADPVNADESQQAPEADADMQGDVARAAASYSFAYDEDSETQCEYNENGNFITDKDGKKLYIRDRFNLKDENDDVVVGLDSLSDPIVSTVKYQWYAGNTALGDAKLLSEEGKNPVDAGTYKLVLTLPKKDGDGGYAAATGEFTFEITKAEVEIWFEEPAEVVPGTAVGDVPVPPVSRIGNDDKAFTYVLDENGAPGKDNEVKLTPVIKDAETGTTLKEGKLAADKEYVITAAPEFIGAKMKEYNNNYSFKACAEQKLSFEELKETRLSVTLDESKYPDKSGIKLTKGVALANNSERTVHVIEAQTVAAAAVDEGKPAFKDPKLETPDGEDDKGQPKWKDITKEVTDKTLYEGAWYTAADYAAPWTEADKTFCSLTVGGKLDEAPETAGAYVYRYSYKGDDKEYAESFADILVIVEVPEIVVRPTVAEGTKFYDGQPVREVLAKIGYELPYADGGKDANGKDKLDITENMWGTSYVDTSRTQPYKPDFVLTKIKDGTEFTYASDSAVLDLEEGAEYYVRFNGSKAVYDASGSVKDRTGIMEGVDSMDPDTCGFKVKTGDDVYVKNELKIDVVAAGSKIVTDEIKAEGMDSTKLNVLDVFVKTYDGLKIFTNHADYKNAKLDSGDTDSKRDFVYTWQSGLDYDDLIATEKDEDGKDKFTYTEEDIKDSFDDVKNIISPVNAGVYRLEIKYKDPKGEKFAEPAYVYFVIKPQEITFDLSATLKAGITGYTSGYDVIENNRDLLADTSITVEKEMSGKPSKSEDWKNEAVFSEAADYAYQVNWLVYEKLTETVDGKEVDRKDENGDILYDKHEGSLTTDAGKYFVKAESVELGHINSNGSYKTNINNSNFTVKKDDKLMIPITVKEMGTEEIKFAGITTSGEGDDRYWNEKTYDGESIYKLIKDKLAVFNAPITVGEDGKTKKADVKDTDAKLTYTVSYYPDNDRYGEGKEETYSKLPTEAAAWDWAKDSGNYTIRVGFKGNDKYCPLYDEHPDGVLLCEIHVNQRELTLVLPTLKKTYETGEDLRAALDDAAEAFKELSGAGLKGDILEADKKYFTKTKLPNGEQGYLAWYGGDDGDYYYTPGFMVYDIQNGCGYTYDDLDDYYWGEIAFSKVGDKQYSLKLAESGLSGDAAINYYFDKADPASTPIKVGRGASDVWMHDGDGRELDIADKVTDRTDPTDPVVKDHQVKVLDAIPYTYGEPEGNIVTITIQAPAEYQDDDDFDWNKVSYEQSIKNHAKKNLVGKIRTYENQLSFRYNATDKEDLHFSIRWAADYNEDFTFLFNKADMIGNLRDAVAPKSLAFNAPLTSMVVGQEQDLDVKITKEQMSDVICLGYEVTVGKGEILHVSEHGTVTALKEGKATVEVFPMHLVNGKKEPIKDANDKLIKSAKVNITVKDVSAPKVSKVIAHDDYAVVQYALPNKNDGYRREIYVLADKNVKAEEFERKLDGIDADAMKNEQWKGIFAVAPKFVSYSTEYYNSRVYDAKKHAYSDTVQIRIDGLIPGKTDYTVYVRNVSAMRSLEDDCKVTLSRKGTPKGFTTTLIETSDIVATLDDSDVYRLDGDELDTTLTSDEIKDEIRNADEIEYNVPLSQKSAQISLEALFTGEAGDEEYLPLALGGDDKKKYTDPKITYYFKEWIYDSYDARYGWHRIEEKGYTSTSNIGTIAKNGKMSLKNVGTAVICAVDTVSGAESEDLIIHVTAEADSITARKADMQVGQRIKLENLVDYKEKTLKLGQSYNDIYARIDVKAAKASLGENENFTITDDGYLIAEGVGSAEFDLKDENIEGREGTANIKVTAKALDAVKGLNVVNVINNRFDVRFEMNPYAEAYRINIKDGRGSLIRGIYVENIPFNYKGEVLWDGVDKSKNGWTRGDYSAYDDDWGYRAWTSGYTHNRENWAIYNADCYANMIKGKMNLTYRIDRLTQSSKYTVEVTTLYKEVEPGKPVTKTVTTTKMPAFDWVIDTEIEAGMVDNDGNSIYDGMTICDKDSGDDYDDIVGGFFVSGNTYSLKAGNYNRGARYAETDTLTWSSSNSKVASVRATSGGYSAILTALKNGETVIEVKSKVLKGVIARYTIEVSTVGDAYSRHYYGENEDQNSYGDSIAKKLVIGVPVVVDHKGGSIKYEFTAMEEGTYELYKVVNGKKVSIDSIDIEEVDEEGEEREFPYTSSGVVSVSKFAGSLVVRRTGSTINDEETSFKNRKTVKAGEQFTAKSGAWYAFTAPDDGFYGIKNGNSYSTSILNVYEPVKEDDAVQVGKKPVDMLPVTMNNLYELKKNQLIYLESTNDEYDYSATIEKVTFGPLKAGDSITLSPYSSKWYEFKAAEAGNYVFTKNYRYSGVIYLYNENGDFIGYCDDYGYDTCSCSCTAEQKVYVYMYADYNTMNVTVSKEAAE